MAKRPYKTKMPYDKKDIRFWLTLEQLKKLDILCKERGITKTELMSTFVDNITKEIELAEAEVARIEEEKLQRAARGFYVAGR